MRIFGFILCAFLAASATAQDMERLTLRSAVQMALSRNLDVTLAQIEREKADAAVDEAAGPFMPQLFVGSGLAYTNGIPQSAEGATPSVVQGVGRMFVYNREQRYRVRQARASVQAAEVSTEATREDVALRAAGAYLDLALAKRQLELAAQQVASLVRVEDAVRLRVEEGREIPLELSAARLERLKAEQAHDRLARAAELRAENLRVELGMAATARLDVSRAEEPLTGYSATDAYAEAETASAALRRLDAQATAQGFAIEAARSERYPRLDLVAQYALLSRFNNYDQFFNDFQRHNGQIGISLQVPVFRSKVTEARVARATLEQREIATRREATARAVRLESLRVQHDMDTAGDALELRKAELDFAREQVSVQLALFEEGRIAVDALERARIAETGAWSDYYEARTASQRARLALLKQTGRLLAAFE